MEGGRKGIDEVSNKEKRNTGRTKERKEGREKERSKIEKGRKEGKEG